MDNSPVQIEIQKAQLADLAIRFANNLDELRKPLIIEFSGTPKAGKTTCVDALAKFLRRNEIPVYTVTERASFCPIRSKANPYFNIWTGNHSLSQLLEAMERPAKVIILDRGLFDSMVWLNLHLKEERIQAEDYETVEKFYLLDLWSRLIDIVVTLSVEPNLALYREFKDQITDREGSIMNHQVLGAYNASLEYCRELYKARFRTMVHVDTTNREPRDGVALIASQVLSAAEMLIDEEIATVDRNYVNSVMPSTGVASRWDLVKDIMEHLPDRITWLPRSQAENDRSRVQLIPVSSLLRKDEILVMNVRGNRQGRMVNRDVVWAGGHVRKSDSRSANGRVFRESLLRELREELKFQPNPHHLSTMPRAIIWDASSPRSAQHLGLFYEYETEKGVAELHLRELYESQYKSLFTEFKPIDKNLADLENLETWSTFYLREVHKIDFPLKERQGVLL